MPNEVWKPIAGFPGYEASDQGQIRSWVAPRGMRSFPRVLTGGRDKDGYVKFVLCPGGRREHVRRASLIAITFIGPRPPGMVVCHGNNDRTDDRAVNLRWDTQKANIADQERHGTRAHGEDNPQAILTEEQVAAIRAGGGSLRVWAERLGVSRSTIDAVRRRRNWKHAA